MVSRNGNYSSHFGRSYNIHYSVLVDLYENFKILEIIESRKLRGNVEDTVGLERFLSCIIISEKFLAYLNQALSILY